MSVTDFGALSDAQKRVWSTASWKQFRDESFWGYESNGKGRFIDGSGVNSVVQLVSELSTTDSGKSCVMQLINDLDGDGVAGDNLLAGNEESMSADAQIIKVDMLRNAVQSKGQMAETGVIFKFRTEAKDQLSFWFANKMDELMFLTASGVAYTSKLDGTTRSTGSQLPSLNFASDVVAPSTNRKKFAGSATSTATLTVADKMSWNLLVSTRQFAVRKKVRPIKSGGRDFYVVVLSPEQRRDLVTDPTYQTIVRSAGSQGTNNPLFTGAIAVVEGLVIYEHNKVYTTLEATSGSGKWGSGSTVDGAQALVLGAQAMGLAKMSSDRAMWVERGDNDYQNRPGIGYGQKFGLLKPQFKPTKASTSREDYGVVSLYTAAAA
jgi:N4-gp56 family major capsid protein